jgi:hypothetical protein
MSAPAVQLTVTQRYRLKDLAWQRSGVVPPGRAMLCKGRRVVGFCSVSELVARRIDVLADTVCLSAADFADVKRWLA